GFDTQHTPELVRMASDEELIQSDPDSTRVWAPLHAWRVLGQLGAPEATDLLPGLLLGKYEWALTECLDILDRMGPRGLPVLTAVLTDPSRSPEARQTAAYCVGGIGREYPEVRSACVEALGRAWEEAAKDNTKLNTKLNTILIDVLTRLKAVPQDPASCLL